jgi:hypothetical protein
MTYPLKSSLFTARSQSVPTNQRSPPTNQPSSGLESDMTLPNVIDEAVYRRERTNAILAAAASLRERTNAILTEALRLLEDEDFEDGCWDDAE